MIRERISAQHVKGVIQVVTSVCCLIPPDGR